MGEFWNTLVKGLTPADKSELPTWWKVPLIFFLIIVFLIAF